tara:strand:- start:1955 stop:2167 length:213 start_codon:yes stop_codon:yes gene_type:complete
MESNDVNEAVLTGYDVEWGLPEIVEGFGDPFGNRYTEERIIRRNGRMYFIYEDRNQMMDSLTGEWFPLPT